MLCAREEVMFKSIAFIGFLTLVVTFNVNAHESDRIDQMEKEMQEIKLRLSELESFLSSSSKTENLVKPGEGWKSVSSWRKLTTYMSYSDVKNILGEPHRVDGGDFATWYYQNGGEVDFMLGKVSKWNEPRK